MKNRVIRFIGLALLFAIIREVLIMTAQIVVDFSTWIYIIYFSFLFIVTLLYCWIEKEQVWKKVVLLWLTSQGVSFLSAACGISVQIEKHFNIPSAGEFGIAAIYMIEIEVSFCSLILSIITYYIILNLFIKKHM